MSARTDVLLWAHRVLSRVGQPPHTILEIKADATLDEAQEAFHKVARMAHPDLHRRSMSAEDLDLLERAYARAAGAYQDFRGQRAQTTRIRAIKDVPAGATVPGVPHQRIPTPPGTPPLTPTGEAQPQMNTKARLYFQKGEMCLKRGDLRGALLRIQMAIAADPQSAFLRSALVEIDAELAKK